MLQFIKLQQQYHSVTRCQSIFSCVICIKTCFYRLSNVITEQCFHWVCSFSSGGFLAVARVRVVRRNRGVDGCQPNSSHLKPLDFNSGIILKERLYSNYSNTVIDISNIFHNQCHQFNWQNLEVQRITPSLRVEALLRAEGSHFQHILYT